VSGGVAHEEAGGGGGHAAGSMERWLLTYADMITLLMAFFIMMYSMSVLNQEKFKQAAESLRTEFGPKKPTAAQGAGLLPGAGNEESPQLEQDVQSVEDRLQDYVKKNNLEELIRTSHRDRSLVISVASDNLLFARGEAELRPPALAILDKVAGLLQRIPNAITVEGHTCDLPISTQRFPSNWELSAARACSVVRYLAEEKGLDPNRLAATGYGASRPVAPNDSEDGRVRNRRVDLVILSHGAPDSSVSPEGEQAPPASDEGGR